MLSLKRSLIIAWSLLCLLALAACSGIPTSGNTATYTDPATSANTQTQNTNTQKSTTKPTSTQTQIQVTQQKPVTTIVATPTPAPTNNQNTGSTTNGGQNAPAMPTNNNQNTNQTYPTPTPSQSTTGTGSNSQNTGNQNMTGPTFIRVTPMFINGQTLQILTTGTGMTLYYRTSDVPPNAVCTGTCAQSWPPLLAHGQIITSASITSGSLTMLKTANGKQLAYNGYPLYTYVGDTMPGQINGQGLDNVWQIVSVKTQIGHW